MGKTARELMTGGAEYSDRHLKGMVTDRDRVGDLVHAISAA